MVSVGSGERVVAGWILERRLGSGGYGEVWQARRRHVDLVRALKLIPIVSEGAFESWRHEIGRLEALNHPSVVRFYDADIVSDGPYRDYAWIATELCDRSLADALHLREHRVLPWAEGEKLLDAMLAALSAAHAAGMVHRDIKPANIVRHRDGTWKLCDFGTARLVPADSTHPVTQVIGTSPYMSPAAHRGQQNQAADLYALGVTVHEALKGERLHPRREDMTDSEYVKTVLDTPPTISRDLPRRWRTVVGALIGQHGRLGAADLATWFTTTRGDRPPTAATIGANGSAPATGATAAAGSPPANGAVARTGPTALAAGAAPAPPSAPEVRRVHIPAPDVDAASANGNGKSAAAAAPSRPAPPRPGAPSPPASAPASPSPGSGARPGLPAPGQPNGAAVGYPYGGAPGSGGHPYAPPAPKPPPIWTAAAVDPTSPMGRRVFAVLVDSMVILLVAYMFFASAVRVLYEPAHVGSGSDTKALASCQEAADSLSCHQIGDTVYVWASGSLSLTPFLVFAGLLVLVVVQGLTGATVGKVLAGIRVVGPDGNPPGVPRALMRTVLLLIDAFPYVVPVLGWFVALANARHRRLGDLAAGTMVVRRRALAYIRR